jgi:hypothetical protein
MYYIINMNIEIKYTAQEYIEFSESILDDENKFWPEFLDWVTKNESDLKMKYQEDIALNKESALDSSFWVWALELWPIDKYNKLKTEIEEMIGE